MPRKAKRDGGHEKMMDRGDYPKKAGARYVREEMHEMEEHPGKFPGGRKQAIAIELSRARRGRGKRRR